MTEAPIRQKSQIVSLVLAAVALVTGVAAYFLGRAGLADDLDKERARNACLVEVESRADVVNFDYDIAYGEYVLTLGGAGRMSTEEAQALIEAALVAMERSREERADSAEICP